ncbi:MAG TPA: ATP-binding protein [Coxiellaceae bacterium]|nr:ATP-binding protein [Coxiellaceae bacterium]
MHVVHADYAQQGAPIRLSFFDDRIEIENPGLLLFGLTVDEIKRGVSKLRNRVIGQVFYRLGLIERWGSGIRRIIDSCEAEGFAEPQFEEIGTHFRVTLYTQAIKAPLLKGTDEAIIEALKNADDLSTKEISEMIGKSARLTRSRLLVLIDRDLVGEIGQGINDPKRRYFLRK